MSENHPLQGDDAARNITSKPGWVGYAATVTIEILITAILVLIGYYLPLGRYPITYVLAIGIIANYFGKGPAILAFILGILAFGYFFNTPVGKLWPVATTPMALAGWIAFIIGTSLVAIGMILIHKSEHKVHEVLIQAERELTERRHVEMALRHAEENYRTLFAYTPAAVFAYDSQGTILQANTACEKLFDIPNDYMVGRTLFETVARSKNKEEVEERINYIFSGGAMENIEWLDTRPNGEQRWILTNITPVSDSMGNVIMGLSLNIDITERKKAEQLQNEQDAHKLEFYRRTIMAATDGKLVITERSEICGITGSELASWEINNVADPTIIRHSVTEYARAKGMEELKIELLLTCVGESTANAYKHAGKGTASLHRMTDGLIFIVSDQGPGIPALNIPNVALTLGYSTAESLGMGYKIMISYCDKVYLATGVQGTMVGLYMKFHSS